MISENNTEKLLQLQQVEYSLLDTFIKICSTYDLKYYLAYGTLLGCVRHQGFIPWDDDVDVFMPREDYNRFLQIPAEDLPQGIHIRTYQNTEEDDPNISFQTKFESTTKAVVRVGKDETTKQMIWIDIFVIDGMPKSKLSRDIHYSNLQYKHSLFRVARSAKHGVLKDKKRSRSEKIALAVLKVIPFGKMLSVKKCMNKTEKAFAKYPFDSGEYVIGYAPEYGKKRILKREWFEGNRTARFGNLDCSIPNKSEEVLTAWYGDYLKLPPEEERIPKHSCNVLDV